MNSPVEKPNIELGLALLSKARQPDATMEARDIAAWCNCSERVIFEIQERALRKVRDRLRRKLGMSVEDFSQARLENV